MDIQRFTERADAFIRAAARLTEACEQPFTPFIRDSVIQRFEFCWELAWKILKLRLEMVGIEVLTPRDVFQESLNKGLIRDGNAWVRHRRCATSPAIPTTRSWPILNIAFWLTKGNCFLKNWRRT